MAIYRYIIFDKALSGDTLKISIISYWVLTELTISGIMLQKIALYAITRSKNVKYSTALNLLNVNFVLVLRGVDIFSMS